MGDFDELDAHMRAAHANALDALATRISVEEWLRQMLEDVQDPPSGHWGPGT